MWYVTIHYHQEKREQKHHTRHENGFTEIYSNEVVLVYRNTWFQQKNYTTYIAYEYASTKSMIYWYILPFCMYLHNVFLMCVDQTTAQIMQHNEIQAKPLLKLYTRG